MRRIEQVIGWNFALDDNIFVERDWKTDFKILINGIEKLLSNKSRMILFITPEGQYFSEQLYENSVEYAKQKGMTPFKYHLFPKTKGINLLIRHLKEKCIFKSFLILNI